MMMSDTGIVKIGNKEYKTVAKRVAEFRDIYQGWSIETEVLDFGEAVRVKATIRDGVGSLIATGHAEEIRGATTILKTSAVEVAETSAVGRALAYVGFGGSEIASAEEVELALEQQKEIPIIEHNAVVREWLDHIVAIKSYILSEDWGLAYESYAEIPRDIMEILWRAPTKGGIFTTAERGAMKSNDWNSASHAYHGTFETKETE
jgi:hypothetical protein